VLKSRLLVSAFLLAAATLSAQNVAQNDGPQFRRDLLAGAWQVNWEKSTPARPPASSPAMFRQYQDRGDGFMFHTVIVAQPGKTPELQLLGAIKYDNKEYPTYTPARLTEFLASGKIPAQTVSFKVVDAYNMEWADRTSGKITAYGTMTLSPDGRTLRLTSKSPSPAGKEDPGQILMFEKQ
jgi:hypothetical protein